MAESWRENTTSPELTSGEEDEEMICGYFEGYSDIRFIVITLSSAIAFFGFIANLLLLAVFKKTLPSSVYLATISVLDSLICLTYLLLFGVDAGSMYLRSELLFFLYHQYIVPVFFVAKVVQFAIPFMLILATLERFVWTAQQNTREFFAPMFSDTGRCVTVFILTVVSVSVRLPVLLAIKVEQFPKCEDALRSESVAPTEWAVNSEAYYFFDVHVMVAVQTLLPFVILMILNFIIVKRLLNEKKQESGKTRRHFFASKKHSIVNTQQKVTMPENYALLEITAELMKESLLARSCHGKRAQLRNAINTMLAIVMSYLVCNGLHLVLTFLERTGSSLLVDPSDPTVSSSFYIVISDLVSFCYMFTSAIRIIIYSKCNPKLRADVANFLFGKGK